MKKNGQKKKNRVLVIALLLVFTALLVSAYFLVKNLSEKDEAQDTTPGEEQDESVALSKYTLADVVSLSFTQGGEGYTIVKSGSVWKMSDDPDFPVDQQVADVIASEAASVTADRLLEETRVNFPKYGLSSPKIIVRISYSDGTDLSLAFGDYNSTVKAYYAHVYETYNVYLINESFINTLNHDYEYFRDQTEDTADTAETGADTDSVTSNADTDADTDAETE